MLSSLLTFKLLANNSYYLLSASFILSTLLSVLYSISFNLSLRSYRLGKAAQRGKVNFLRSPATKWNRDWCSWWSVWLPRSSLVWTKENPWAPLDCILYIKRIEGNAVQSKFFWEPCPLPPLLDVSQSFRFVGEWKTITLSEL